MAENTANFCGGNSIKSRYYDIINSVSDDTTDETAEEIINRMKLKLYEMGGVTDGRF